MSSIGPTYQDVQVAKVSRDEVQAIGGGNRTVLQFIDQIILNLRRQDYLGLFLFLSKAVCQSDVTFLEATIPMDEALRTIWEPATVAVPGEEET